VGMTFSGWVATLAGWFVTEIGRQPWLVTGILTTKQAASDVAAGMIGTTLALYLATYVVLIVAYVTVLFHLAGKGDKAAQVADVPGGDPLKPVGILAMEKVDV
jgi:cytochrome d ubiquinol oxidase subunit I